jgi:DNA-binding transcriptional regulator YhcF (GntR family)
MLDDGRPLFLQIKEGIEADIVAGVLLPHQQIPSNSQLVSFYQINPVTVLKGVSLLADEGTVYKKRGLGMFVSPDAPELLRSRYQGSFARDYIEPLVRQAKTLGFDLPGLQAHVADAWSVGQKEETP